MSRPRKRKNEEYMPRWDYWLIGGILLSLVVLFLIGNGTARAVGTSAKSFFAELTAGAPAKASGKSSYSDSVRKILAEMTVKRQLFIYQALSATKRKDAILAGNQREADIHEATMGFDRQGIRDAAAGLSYLRSEIRDITPQESQYQLVQKELMDAVIYLDQLGEVAAWPPGEMPSSLQQSEFLETVNKYDAAAQRIEMLLPK